ncbi:MAG: carboxylesterase family protein [Hyphomonadaceae bacterium]|nr:carboxylesterase family protein [Hyphomonadaceae bacterium]
MRWAWMVAVAALLFVAASGASFAEERVRARVTQGAIEGVRQDGVDRFLGVPYAAAPVGELRWRAPVAAPAWSGVRPAMEYGASCMQAPRPPWGPYTREYLVQARPPSEDCLTLNVWTPSARRSGRLPILVWIHGGAFIGGGSSVPIYDGAALARRGIIVVSLNYRLGTFGFFAGEDGAANFAVLDAIEALRWLRSNAAAFGGDGERITIAGQSAGAALVNILLVAPEAQGLYAGAISQSMPVGGVRMRSRAEAEHARRLFLRAFGVDSADALRAVAPERILEATQLITPGPMAPIIDGVTLPGDPLALAMEGRTSAVPLLAGVTADESTFDGGLLGYRTLFAERFGARAQRFLQLYPAANDLEARAMARASNRDRLVLGLAQWTHRSAGRLHLYMFSHVEPGPGASAFGAFHSSEIPYAFGTLGVAPERGFRDEDHAVSSRMTSYWANFTKRGDPNARGLPEWPAATRAAPTIMELGGGWAPLARPDQDKAAFFSEYFADDGRATLF